jgi:hypothetical protein
MSSTGTSGGTHVTSTSTDDYFQSVQLPPMDTLAFVLFARPVRACHWLDTLRARCRRSCVSHDPGGNPQNGELSTDSDFSTVADRFITEVIALASCGQPLAEQSGNVVLCRFSAAAASRFSQVIRHLHAGPSILSSDSVRRQLLLEHRRSFRVRAPVVRRSAFARTLGAFILLSATVRAPHCAAVGCAVWCAHPGTDAAVPADCSSVRGSYRCTGASLRSPTDAYRAWRSSCAVHLKAKGAPKIDVESRSAGS